jgi:hypothetical protein
MTESLIKVSSERTLAADLHNGTPQEADRGHVCLELIGNLQN